MHTHTHCVCVCVYWCAYFTPVFPRKPTRWEFTAQTLMATLWVGAFLFLPCTTYTCEMSLQMKCLSINNWYIATAVYRAHPLRHFPGRIPSHFVPVTWQRLNTACRTHSCPSTNSWPMMPSLLENAISKTCKFKLAVWYLFGKGDNVSYHLDDCCLVSGSSRYQTFTSCNNLPLEAVILHWLFSLLATVPTFPSIVSKQLQNKLCTDQFHPQLPMLVHTRYPLHIQPYRWLHTGWHTPAASSLKLFQHSEKMVSHCRLVFQQFLPTSDVVIHSWFLEA
jgi:hypothetical protein